MVLRWLTATADELVENGLLASFPAHTPTTATTTTTTTTAVTTTVTASDIGAHEHGVEQLSDAKVTLVNELTDAEAASLNERRATKLRFPLHAVAEIRAVRALIQLLGGILGGLATSLEEDDADLTKAHCNFSAGAAGAAGAGAGAAGAGAGGWHKCIALTFRRDKKAVLHEAVAHLEAHIAGLASSHNAAIATVALSSTACGGDADADDNCNAVAAATASSSTPSMVCGDGACLRHNPTATPATQPSEALPSVFAQQAAAMPTPLRQLLVEGVSPERVSPAALFRSLQLSEPAYRAARRGMDGEPTHIVQRQVGVLSAESCAKLRAAVDHGQTMGVDTVVRCSFRTGFCTRGVLLGFTMLLRLNPWHSYIRDPTAHLSGQPEHSTFSPCADHLSMNSVANPEVCHSTLKDGGPDHQLNLCELCH
jgi:hypothetical protein